jgi:hypothetical protein
MFKDWELGIGDWGLGMRDERLEVRVHLLCRRVQEVCECVATFVRRRVLGFQKWRTGLIEQGQGFRV